jgi:hypothetical protein
MSCSRRRKKVNFFAYHNIVLLLAWFGWCHLLRASGGQIVGAGLLFGILSDYDWATTGRIASLLGAIKIEHNGTQNHSFRNIQVVRVYFFAYHNIVLLLAWFGWCHRRRKKVTLGLIRDKSGLLEQ